MLARFARNAIQLKHSRTMATIPVDHVARVVRMHVADEEAAMKADDIVQKALGLIRKEKPAGFIEARRTVCKAEWAYEVEMVFTAADFGTYMESDFRETTMQPILGEMAELATDPTAIYSGNRVYNHYTL